MPISFFFCFLEKSLIHTKYQGGIAISHFFLEDNCLHLFSVDADAQYNLFCLFYIQTQWLSLSYFSNDQPKCDVK